MDSLPWMTKLLSRLGIKEVPGAKDNPLIMEMYQYGNYPVQHDEVPWCACCANWALITSGFKGTHSAAAISFKEYGAPCELKEGCVVVVEFPNGSHHVTFFDKVISNNSDGFIISCLGGNQSNELKYSNFNVSGGTEHCKIIATRWPVESL